MITLISFGFKYGPPNANYYFDVGFLKNPSRDKNWTFFSNPDDEMKQFVLAQPDASTLINYVTPLIIFLSTIDQNQIFAFGCSAGRHRSYIIVNALADKLREQGIGVNVKHRDS